MHDPDAYHARFVLKPASMIRDAALEKWDLTYRPLLVVPTFLDGEEPYAQLGFSFSQFRPIDFLILE